MLVLEVGLSVVTDDPVGIGGWGTARFGRVDLSVQGVVQPLEQTVSEVKVSDWVDAVWEVDAPGVLAVSVGPVVLDAFHVELVHDYNDPLFWALVDGLEEILVSLVDEYALELGEVNIGVLDEPIDHVWVQALLSELGWL